MFEQSEFVIAALAGFAGYALRGLVESCRRTEPPEVPGMVAVTGAGATQYYPGRVDEPEEQPQDDSHQPAEPCDTVPYGRDKVASDGGICYADEGCICCDCLAKQPGYGRP